MRGRLARVAWRPAVRVGGEPRRTRPVQHRVTVDHRWRFLLLVLAWPWPVVDAAAQRPLEEPIAVALWLDRGNLADLGQFPCPIAHDSNDLRSQPRRRDIARPASTTLPPPTESWYSPWKSPGYF